MPVRARATEHDAPAGAVPRTCRRPVVSIEQSNGKARPTLPRSSDLKPVETVPDPSEGRAPGGRFAPGNRISEGQRWKASIRKLLGKGASSEQAANLAREAFRLYLAVLRGLPSDGPTVRMLAALQARHAVLAAFFTDRAAELGLETDAGAVALEQATKHGQRAERLAVTTLDVATKLHGSKPDPMTSSLNAGRAEFQRTLLERQRAATTRPADASSTSDTSKGASDTKVAPAGAEEPSS
jgi:hypothetical protein